MEKFQEFVYHESHFTKHGERFIALGYLEICPKSNLATPKNEYYYFSKEKINLLVHYIVL